MDAVTQELVSLIDQAIDLAQERLVAKRAGRSDPASEQGLEQILRGLRYRRDEAVTTGYEVEERDTSLGLIRAALEYDAPGSALLAKIYDVEQHFKKHFVRPKH